MTAPAPTSQNSVIEAAIGREIVIASKAERRVRRRPQTDMLG